LAVVQFVVAVTAVADEPFPSATEFANVTLEFVPRAVAFVAVAEVWVPIATPPEFALEDEPSTKAAVPTVPPPVAIES